MKTKIGTVDREGLKELAQLERKTKRLRGKSNDCDCGSQDGSEHKPHSDGCNVYKNVKQSGTH